MKIAILGAGFAGLAVTWHLLALDPSLEVTLFDQQKIGGGASGLSSGLLHPFGGLRAKKTWNAEAGLDEAKSLINSVCESSREPLIEKGLLRPACTLEQIKDFHLAAQKYASDVLWWSREKCLEAIPYLHFPEPTSGALYIPGGVTLNTRKYLAGLFDACEKKGARLVQKKIESIEELDSFDQIICALGAHTASLLGSFNLPPLSTIKGQLLTFNWPETLPPPAYSLISQGYLVMSPDKKTCMVGATFERDYRTFEPESSTAYRELVPKIALFFPQIRDLTLIDCQAGARICYKSHLPLVDALSKRVWIFTAMGSKGLIYHAWLGKLLAKAIVNQSPQLLPNEVRIKR